MSTGACEKQKQRIAGNFIDRQPIGRDVTLSTTDVVPSQRVIVVYGTQRFAGGKFFNDISKRSIS
jgi:hypothetical protein